LRSGREVVLEPGSQSVAWRSDGALAYVIGDPPAYRANLPFLSNVVVRSAIDAAPAQWSTGPARYRVLGWAGRTLLVAVGQVGASPDLVAIDAPGRARTLSEASLLLGISPDGTRALVTETPAETAHPHVRLLRIADGAEVAAIPVADARDPVSGDPTAWISAPGSWLDDRVVVGSETGLVIFRVEDSISVDQVLHIDSATRQDGALFEPHFVDRDARTIVAWSGVPGTQPRVRAMQLRCDRIALACTRSAAVAPGEIPRPVDDLSGGGR
jgi:hypothetical protein